MSAREFPMGETLFAQLVDGGGRRNLAVDHFPFQIGRAPECNLILPQVYVSRHHAQILRESGHFLLLDTSSRHGTYVNGEPIKRHQLTQNDVVQFGSLEGPQLRLQPLEREPTTNHTILAHLHDISGGGSDLEKLRWFLAAAQELNAAGKVERVLASLLETTLKFARVERGYVFLRSKAGVLDLALGMNAQGDHLTDTHTISSTVLSQAIQGGEQFIITDTLAAEGSVADSIVAHSIRTIICIPLRQMRGTRNRADETTEHQVFGALYLDSRFEPGQVSEIDHGLLRTIAREAAALVENAQLAEVEDQARKQQEELQIAARIQQGLMAVQIPSLPFAEVQAHSLACYEVGGDFFDVVHGLGDTLNVALVDVSGKGIAAAILASTLQGMIYVQLQTGQPLQAIAATTNSYLCAKNVGKYATMLLLRLYRDGRLEYLNCGHIRPRICEADHVRLLEASNLPVGLLPYAAYQAGSDVISAGSRVVLVSDGFTEAENDAGEFFGEERLDDAVRCSDIQSALDHMLNFCATNPATDDITIVQVHYRGGAEGFRPAPLD